MLSHRNYCVVEDAAPNAVFDNYTASEFNREMNRGNINPHHVQRSHAFKNQLHDIGPIRDMVSTYSQDNESSSVRELPPMNVMTDIPDTYQPDESEDEAINELDLDSENDDDMNLDGQDRDVEEEALLPSMFNDVAYMYETVKSRIPPDTMKPDSKKIPKRHLSNINCGLIQTTKLIVVYYIVAASSIVLSLVFSVGVCFSIFKRCVLMSLVMAC